MKKGISTIIASIILVVITIGLISTAYLYFAGLIGSSTRGTIQLLDAYCRDSDDSIFVIVQNKGTSAITTLTWTLDGSVVTADDPTTIATGDCSNTISVDGSLNCNVSAGGSGMYEVRVMGPANAVGGTVQCK